MKIAPILFLATALALSATAGPPAEPAMPCCPTPAPAVLLAQAAPAGPHMDHMGHRELPAGDISRESIYQMDGAFTDDSGDPFSLGSLRGHPVLVAMFFASCDYACPLIVADMTRIRDSLPAETRDRARLVLVSFDIARDTPAALKRYRAQRLLDSHWSLLHGDDDAVRELAALLGVKFKQEAGGQFSHSNLITILNSEGEIVHQRAGLRGGLEEASHALAQASR